MELIQDPCFFAPNIFASMAGHIHCLRHNHEGWTEVPTKQNKPIDSKTKVQDLENDIEKERAYLKKSS